MARHAVVDIAQIFNSRPREHDDSRCQPVSSRAALPRSPRTNVPLRGRPRGRKRLAQLRGMYEPYVLALAEHLQMPLPRGFTSATPWNTGRRAPFERNPQAVAETFESVCRESPTPGDSPAADPVRDARRASAVTATEP